MEEQLENIINQASNFFTPAMQGLFAGLISTVFVRSNTAKSELEKIKAGKFSEVIDKLIKDGKMTYTELYRCNNLFKVAKLADNVLKTEKTEGKEIHKDFNFDWFMRFYDAVGNISNLDLQKLWGNILAGEINSPGSCSLRTLDVIRNLSVEEAKEFDELSRYILKSGLTFFVFDFGFTEDVQFSDCREYMQNKHLSYAKTIIPLVEAGLLTLDHDMAFYLKKNNILLFSNDLVECFAISDSDESTLLDESTPQLTTSGLELFNIVHGRPEFVCDREYLYMCINHLNRKYPKVNFSGAERT